MKAYDDNLKRSTIVQEHSVAAVLTISGMRPSSPFGCAMSVLIVVSSVGMLIDGVHEPAGRILSVSKQMRPPVSTLGW
jgi:hypothetical protein